MVGPSEGAGGGGGHASQPEGPGASYLQSEPQVCEHGSEQLSRWVARATELKDPERAVRFVKRSR